MPKRDKLTLSRAKNGFIRLWSIPQIKKKAPRVWQRQAGWVLVVFVITKILFRCLVCRPPNPFWIFSQDGTDNASVARQFGDGGEMFLCLIHARQYRRCSPMTQIRLHPHAAGCITVASEQKMN
jgi:hypothetical protein